jgi:hypothetical protein
MSTTTVAPTINVTAEDWEILRHDPYYISIAVLGDEIDVDGFDRALERSPREHREWLDGLKTQIEWWVTLLKQIEDGVLPAEPEVIELVRRDAVRLTEDCSGHECDDYCRENCVDLARRSALLTALADRLEGALVGAEVPA